MESFPQDNIDNTPTSEAPEELIIDVNAPTREISEEEKKQDEEKNKDLPPPEEINVVI